MAYRLAEDMPQASWSDADVIKYARDNNPAHPMPFVYLMTTLKDGPDCAEVNFFTQPPTVRRFNYRATFGIPASYIPNAIVL